MIRRTWGQIGAVIRLELRKSFLSRRGLWVYLLALAPAFIHVGHTVFVTRDRRRLEAIAAAHPVDARALARLAEGMTWEEVRETVGDPYWVWTARHPRGEVPPARRCAFTDGRHLVRLYFSRDELTGIHRRGRSFAANRFGFAATFQFFYLRLAVFFGCVGIFINLFRGDMLDKSLHVYLLTPIRREVLLLGKYLAGLGAALVLFTGSAAIQWGALVRAFPAEEVRAVLGGGAGAEFAAYVGVTVLACIGYGSVFLAIGLCFRNPVMPTAAVLLWETFNPFLPPALRRTGIIYYLQSLCPVSADPGRRLPPLVNLLISPTEPAGTLTAILGIVLLTAVVLGLAAVLARRLQIDYGRE